MILRWFLVLSLAFSPSAQAITCPLWITWLVNPRQWYDYRDVGRALEAAVKRADEALDRRPGDADQILAKSDLKNKRYNEAVWRMRALALATDADLLENALAAYLEQGRVTSYRRTRLAGRRVWIAHFDNGMKGISVPKPEGELSLGNVARYRFSRLFRAFRVPVTVDRGNETMQAFLDIPSLEAQERIAGPDFERRFGPSLALMEIWWFLTYENEPSRDNVGAFNNDCTAIGALNPWSLEGKRGVDLVDLVKKLRGEDYQSLRADLNRLKKDDLFQALLSLPQANADAVWQAMIVLKGLFRE